MGDEQPVDAYRLVWVEQWDRMIETLKVVAALPESNGYACPVCGGELVFYESGQSNLKISRVDHADDCPLVAARALIDELGERERSR